ncbi:MAG: hypothetical protein K0R50_398 [Eubacterium sp.]|nr:hypothetical protein [Eubacterium sp.]
MNYIRVNQVGANSLDRINKILAGVQGGIWKVTSAAMKRAGETAKTRAGEFAASQYAINKNDFMRKVKIKSHIASEDGGVVSMSISYSGNVIPLLTFNTKFSRGGEVQTQVKKGGAATVLKHAFAAKIFGPISIFERVGTSRFPVEQKFGPSAAHMMQNDEVIKMMDETIRETYEKRIEHEITRVLAGIGGGRK